MLRLILDEMSVDEKFNLEFIHLYQPVWGKSEVTAKKKYLSRPVKRNVKSK